MGRGDAPARRDRRRRLQQFIFPLLFFKRLCDVYDEERQRALDEAGGDEDLRDHHECGGESAVNQKAPILRSEPSGEGG